MEKTELVKPEPTGTVPELGKQSRRFRGGRALGLLIGTVVLFGAIASVSDTFLSPYTMFIIARQIAFSILIAFVASGLPCRGWYEPFSRRHRQYRDGDSRAMLSKPWMERLAGCSRHAPVRCCVRRDQWADHHPPQDQFLPRDLLGDVRLYGAAFRDLGWSPFHHPGGFRIYRAERGLWCLLGVCACLLDPPGYRIHVFLHRLRSANACHRRQ